MMSEPITLKVFAVFDSKLGAFANPFVAQSQGQAQRSFVKASLDPDHEFHTHGADFTLFEIGEWRPEKGELVPVSHVNHGNALVLRTSYEAQMAASATPLKEVQRG